MGFSEATDRELRKLLKELDFEIERMTKIREGMLSLKHELEANLFFKDGSEKK